ncbi:MAG: VOC family protein [Candidatus Nanopelagicales bacterium]|jgi:PhnB protein|nr:VOC family protein [Candidatus Nanopelagicales bacterium]
MATVSIYLSFPGTAQEAFESYRSVFGGELTALARVGDMPAAPGQPPLPDEERRMLMHVRLPILGGTILMGSDIIPSSGHEVRAGNATSIHLQPDTYAEARRLFDGLSEGASDITPLHREFWGEWYAALVDRFGIRWMLSCPARPEDADSA